MAWSLFWPGKSSQVLSTLSQGLSLPSTPVPRGFSGVQPLGLHRYFKEFWVWAQAQQGSPCPALWFVIWPFITGSEQTLIILPDHPVSVHSLEGLSKPPEPRPAQSSRALMLSSPAVGHPAADSGACPAKWTLEPRNSRNCASPQATKGDSQIKGAERTKLSPPSIMELDLKITQARPESRSSESTPARTSTVGP